MISILNSYTKDNKIITEYTTDGVNVSHVVEELIVEDINLIDNSNELKAEDIQAQTLLNIEYLVAMAELTSI